MRDPSRVLRTVDEHATGCKQGVDLREILGFGVDPHEGLCSRCAQQQPDIVRKQELDPIGTDDLADLDTGQYGGSECGHRSDEALHSGRLELHVATAVLHRTHGLE